MKRILILLLTLAVLMSGTVCAADSTAKPDSEVTVLQKLNIISGTASVDAEVSRGAFASMLAGLLNIPAAQGDGIFTDVPQSHTYYNQIMRAASVGAMTGRSKYIFAPEDTVLLSEASKALVEVLGYGEIANYEGGYPSGYLAVANRIKLLKGVGAADKLTYGTAYKLLFNALEIPWAQQKTYGGDLSFVESDYNFLYTSFGLRHIEYAVVTADETTALTSPNGCSKGYVTIGKEQYVDINGEASTLLGQGVEIFYSEESGIKQLEMVFASDKTRVTKINSADMVTLEANKISYMNETKIINQTLAVTTDFIYNGVYTSFSNLTTEDLKNCGVTLIDSDGDGSHETVLINKYKVYYVDAVDYENLSFKDKLTEKTLFFDKNDTINVFDASGRKSDFSGIKKKTLISVSESKDKTVKSIYVSADISGGTVTAVESDGFYIDERFYKLGEELKSSKMRPSLGEMGTVYLDKNGLAGAFILKASDGERYGYVLNGKEGKGLGGKMQLRILDRSGEFLSLDINERCRVDGAAISGYTDARLKTLYTDFNVTPPVVSANIVQQLIMYKTNTDGEINYIDTEYMDPVYENENNLYSKSGISDGRYSTDQYTGLYNAKLFIDMSSAVIFNVVENTSEYDESKYSVVDFAAFRSSYGGLAKLKGYNESVVNKTDVVVNYADGEGTVNERTSLFVVDYVSDYSSGDDNSVKIYGFYDGVRVSYMMDADKYRARLPVGRDNLKRCDILKISKNIQDEILTYRIVYNIDSRYTHDSGLPYNNNFQTETCDFTGTVYQTQDNYFVLHYGWSENLDDTFFNNKNYFSAQIQWGGFYIYDEEKDTIEVADSSDLKSYMDYGNRASRLYCRFDWGQCAGTVIIKLKGF